MVKTAKFGNKSGRKGNRIRFPEGRVKEVSMKH